MQKKGEGKETKYKNIQLVSKQVRFPPFPFPPPTKEPLPCKQRDPQRKRW